MAAQVQTTKAGDRRHLGALRMLQAVVATGGIRGLYHGSGITLLRDVPSYGLYFAVFQVRTSGVPFVPQQRISTHSMSRLVRRIS